MPRPASSDQAPAPFQNVVNMLVQAHATEVDALKEQLARAQQSLAEARGAQRAFVAPAPLEWKRQDCAPEPPSAEEPSRNIPGVVVAGGGSEPPGAAAGGDPKGAQQKRSGDGLGDPALHIVTSPARQSDGDGEASLISCRLPGSLVRSELAARLPSRMRLAGVDSELLELATNRVNRTISRFMDEAHEDRRRGRWAYRIVRTRLFEIASYAFVILNSLFIGYSASVTLNCAISESSSPDSSLDCSPDWLEYTEIAFVFWFSVELLMKVMAYDVKAFLDEDNRLWNLLDLFLVTMSWAQIMIIVDNSPTIGLTRNMRLFRITKVIRIFRVLRSCQTLRVMIFAILHSLDALLWVFAVLFFFKYIAALIFMFATADAFGTLQHSAAGGHASEPALPEDLEELQRSFGSLPEAMITLFMCTTGGRDWIEPYEALSRLGSIFGAIFVLFIYFMVFLVMNVIIGTVVDVTHGVSRRDRDHVVTEELSRVREFSCNIKEFFDTADTDKSGKLSWDEFSKYLADDRVKAYFQSLDLDTRQAHVLFTLLDCNDSGEVGIGEFLDGCMRLRGSARSLDLNLAIFQLEQLLTRTSFLERQVKGQVEGRLHPSHYVETGREEPRAR